MDKVKHLNIWVDETILEKIRYIADYNCRSMNLHVRALIQDDIRKFEREIDRIPLSKQ